MLPQVTQQKEKRMPALYAIQCTTTEATEHLRLKGDAQDIVFRFSQNENASRQLRPKKSFWWLNPCLCLFILGQFILSQWMRTSYFTTLSNGQAHLILLGLFRSPVFRNMFLEGTRRMTRPKYLLLSFLYVSLINAMNYPSAKKRKTFHI